MIRLVYIVLHFLLLHVESKWVRILGALIPPLIPCYKLCIIHSLGIRQSKVFIFVYVACPVLIFDFNELLGEFVLRLPFGGLVGLLTLVRVRAA